MIVIHPLPGLPASYVRVLTFRTMLGILFMRLDMMKYHLKCATERARSGILPYNARKPGDGFLASPGHPDKHSPSSSPRALFGHISMLLEELGRH